MNNYIKERVLLIGRYVKETKQTVREAAKEFGISKSSVHLDLSKRLKKIDPKLWKEVNAILSNNFNEKHIRGGEATRKKYLLKMRNIQTFN